MGQKAVQMTRGDKIHKFYFPHHSNFKETKYSKLRNDLSEITEYPDLHLLT